MAGLQAGNTPCVNGKLNGTRVSLLLDTGAVVSVIPESLWHSASGGEPLKREKDTPTRGDGSANLGNTARRGDLTILRPLEFTSCDGAEEGRIPAVLRRLPSTECRNARRRLTHPAYRRYAGCASRGQVVECARLGVRLLAGRSRGKGPGENSLLFADGSLSIQVLKTPFGVDIQGLLGVPRRHYRLRADRGETSGTTDQGAPPPAVRGAEDQAREVPADASKCTVSGSCRNTARNRNKLRGNIGGTTVAQTPLRERNPAILFRCLILANGQWWSWASEQEDALTKLKGALCTSSLMTYPHFDRSFLLDVDVSEYALDAVLSPPHDQGLPAMIAYVSRSFSQPEQMYCAMRRESMNSKFSTGLDHNTGTPMPYPEECRSAGSAGPRIQRRHARATLTKRRQTIMKIHPISRRFQRVGLDLRGPMEETRRGNRYILVVEVIGEVCRLFNVAKTRTTAYHPQCDGLVKRINQTLTDMLVKVSINQPEDWDAHLDQVLLAYRSSVHHTIGATSCQIFGRELRLPADMICGLPHGALEETTGHQTNMSNACTTN
ncbi:Retrovirus-related Pol polyprotein from transposon opus [Trichinella nelsoni]|uniref:Retrovirus-related Pol polyprotein from transposon opus n=1 Tax=Trichinella nelsoni TaxID=6336 RepID=A0A0V0RVP6_9BILA|nr:Retrovirus-related Pol polyprotein from transposon opus [Trichinella nelsoni]